MKSTTNGSSSAALIIALLLLTGITLPVEAQEKGTQLPNIDALSSATADTAAETAADTPPEAAPESETDAVSGATESGGQPLNPKFLGMNVSLSAHKATGYAAGGLFAAAGVIGGIRFIDLMNRSHEYRTDGEGDGGDEDGNSPYCKSVIQNEWASGQELRWTHVGLLAAGESLYLFDALTGLSLIRKDGTTTRAGKIHRNAFFVHAGLMLTELVLGFLETDALQRGDHEMIRTYGEVHTGIGVAIPVVIIGSGLAIDLYPGVKINE